MSCNRRRRQLKAECVAWTESPSIRLACGLNAAPERAQAEHTGDNISFSDSSNELHEKIQCVPFHCFLFFFPFLSPPTNFFSGSLEAADYPSMHQAEGSEVITGFQTYSADASFIPPGSLESPVHLTVGGNRWTCSKTPAFMNISMLQTY